LKERHLLVAVDGSENSRRAVSFVADFLGGYSGFRVTLLHIVLGPAAGRFPPAEATDGGRSVLRTALPSDHG
jgi:nucleotide-binding universal stress UspA family protein